MLGAVCGFKILPTSDFPPPTLVQPALFRSLPALRDGALRCVARYSLGPQEAWGLALTGPLLHIARPGLHVWFSTPACMAASRAGRHQNLLDPPKPSLHGGLFELDLWGAFLFAHHAPVSLQTNRKYPAGPLTSECSPSVKQKISWNRHSNQTIPLSSAGGGVTK